MVAFSIGADMSLPLGDGKVVASMAVAIFFPKRICEWHLPIPALGRNVVRLPFRGGSQNVSFSLSIAHSFILVTSEGRELLAAYGEDHGSSHYNYHAMPNFKAVFPFKGHNKRDVVAWCVGE